MYFPDLSTELFYLGEKRDNEVTFTFIGWLGDKVESKGKVEPWVISAIEHYMVYNYHFDRTCGTHTCEVCWGYDCKDSIWIYGRNARYNLPKMVLHYIEAHDYLPPQAFLNDLKASWIQIEERLQDPSFEPMTSDEAYHKCGLAERTGDWSILKDERLSPELRDILTYQYRGH